MQMRLGLCSFHARFSFGFPTHPQTPLEMICWVLQGICMAFIRRTRRVQLFLAKAGAGGLEADASPNEDCHFHGKITRAGGMDTFYQTLMENWPDQKKIHFVFICNQSHPGRVSQFMKALRSSDDCEIISAWHSLTIG